MKTDARAVITKRRPKGRAASTAGRRVLQDISGFQAKMKTDAKTLDADHATRNGGKPITPLGKTQRQVVRGRGEQMDLHGRQLGRRQRDELAASSFIAEEALTEMRGPSCLSHD